MNEYNKKHRRTGRTPRYLNEEFIQGRPQRPREIGILNGVEELGLVEVTAEGVAHPGVAKGTEGAVEEEGVVVKVQKVVTF